MFRKILLASLMMVVILSLSSQALIPGKINVQGVLKKNGAPAKDKAIIVRFYRDASASNPVTNSIQTDVDIDETGFFSLTIDVSSLGLDFTIPYWVKISSSVAGSGLPGDTTDVGVQPLLSVPYAITSKNVRYSNTDMILGTTEAYNGTGVSVGAKGTGSRGVLAMASGAGARAIMGLGLGGATSVMGGYFSSEAETGYGVYSKGPKDVFLGVYGVGIGAYPDTANNMQLQVGGTGRAFFGAMSESNISSTHGLLIDGDEIRSQDNSRYARLESYDYSYPGNIDLVINPGTGGKVGIGTSLPYTKFHVKGTTFIDGKIGVGTNNPTRAPLEVGDDFIMLALSEHAGYTYSGGNHYEQVNAAGNAPLSIYAAHRIAGSWFLAFSDLRIKNVIGLSKGVEDLETLNKLKVIDFKYIDNLNNGNNIKKGFIAQEVEKVFPQAVSKIADFIPNVYSVAEDAVFDAGSKTLKVTMKEIPDLKVGDTVRLISDAVREKEIIAMSGRSFTVKDWDKETKQVFVFGKKVNDFRNLDYDHIFSLGVSAVQEVSKQVEDLRAKNMDQQKEINSLKLRLEALEKR